MIDSLGQPQRVLLLGGTSELGLAVVRRLGARLEHVVLAGRDADRLAEAGATLPGSPTVVVERFDAADVHGAVPWIVDVCERHGEFDLAVMALGVLGDQERAERNPTEVVDVMQVNLVTPAAISMALATRMARAGRGVLVELSSVAGIRTRRANFVYGASKAGFDAFAQGLGHMVAGSGARVLIVRPGFVVGRMTAGMKTAPMSTTPEAVAEAVAKAIVDGAESVYVPRVLQGVFGVLRLVPRQIFRRLPL